VSLAGCTLAVALERHADRRMTVLSVSRRAIRAPGHTRSVA